MKRGFHKRVGLLLAYAVSTQTPPEPDPYRYTRWLAALARQAQLQGLVPKDFDRDDGLEALAVMVPVARRLLPHAFPVCEDWWPTVERAHFVLKNR